ncbi:DNA-directed RNA polymerase III subunit RPC3 isoform X1 [Falco naumanni]|uniref:DNA-directed RNA polymerase III subunit RPC3 isoform X1 n=1 Tax=Falco naumanni TaxID=148594 RepID=UPI001ADE5E68|nr:DNA-directed RNA polymerase III subunit RPC3 isoform X1 [Falco naumanni]
MTQAEIKLCSLLLQEHFGEIVEKIGTYLIRTGTQPLRMIVSDTGLLLDQVKKALCVLIQHNLVTYQVQNRGFVEYAAQCKRVLRILRYPRYIYTAKTLYNDTGELIVEELLLNGKMTMSAVVRKVADRLTETMEDGKTMDYADVSNTFVRLADTHFVQRCPAVPETVETPNAPPPPAPTLVINEKDMYVVPRLNLVGKGKRRRSCDEEENGEHKAKKQKQDGESPEPPPDDGIYWQVNIDRFHQHFRDQGIVSAVANRMDQTSSEIVRTMLRMSEVTTSSSAPYTQPLSSNEIFRSLPAGYNIGKQVLDQYLTLLADDPLEFVARETIPERRCSPLTLTLYRPSQGPGVSGDGHPGVHRGGKIRFALRQDIPLAPAKEALGAEASGGFCHDPGQGSQGHALQDAVGEFCVPAGDSQDSRPRAIPHLLPLHRERPVLRADAAAPLLQECGQPDGAAPVRDQGEQEAAGEVAAGGSHLGLHAGHRRRGRAAAGDRGDDHGPRAAAAGDPQTQRQQDRRQREPGGRDHLRAGVVHREHREEALRGEGRGGGAGSNKARAADAA